MNLAIITNYWKNSDGGGIEITLTKLVEHFQNNYGIRVDIIFREGYDDEHYSARVNKILFMFKAKKYLNQISPDIIHVQGGWFCLWPALKYKKKKKAAIQYMFHTTIPKELPWFKKLLYNRLLNKCDVVSFVSKAHERNIRTVAKLSIHTKTKVIISGVDKEEVRQNEVESFKKTFNIENSHPILLGMGLTAIEHKAEGARRLIDAIEILAGDYPNIKLLLTREGARSSNLKEYVKTRNLDDKIIFTGTIDNSWVALATCDVYTHVSIGESLGLAALEAMSIGKPVLAARGGGIEEVIENGHNGLLVDPEPMAISKAIKNLMENKQLVEKLSVNAMATIKNYYTWHKVAEKYVNLFREITNDNIE